MAQEGWGDPLLLRNRYQEISEAQFLNQGLLVITNPGVPSPLRSKINHCNVQVV